MKTQTYGMSNMRSFGAQASILLRLTHENKENNWMSAYLAEAYNDYRTNRENGEAQDDPPDKLRYDGKVQWEHQPDGYYHVKYTEGPNNKLWMETKDRNYVFRLEREGRLDVVEPNLHTEVPALYQEAMAYRNGEKKEHQELCIEHLKPHWFKKEYHLEQAELLLLQFDANPNNVLLELAVDSNEIDSIARLFQILQKHHWIINRATISEAINKANRKNYTEMVDFLQQILLDFQHQTNDKEKREQERQAKERQEQEKARAKAKARAEAEARTEAETKVKMEAKKRKPEEEKLEREGIKKEIEEKSFDCSYLIPYVSLKFERELGKGGFGTVYQGKWQFVDVAIKQLYLNSMSTESLEEFQSEAAMMIKLHHPNIVTLYGVSIDQPGKYSLVMEYMPKGSLYTVLHNQQPLDWNLRYHISLDICAGLFHLHQQNILHRDLKSMNVLLDDHMRANLSDFGLSKLKNESTATTTKAGGAAIGTVPWMAPELFKRKSQYTKTSDIYSLGMIFWEIASRLLPFADAIDPMQIIAWKNQGEHENIPKDCPPKYAELITWCWKTQTERPAINQAIEILEQNMRENTPLSAASPSTIYQSGPVYQQNSVDLTEENKSMPNYQLNTLTLKP